MALLDNRNPIVKQFCQAGKSCNEWRDTLFYTGLGALAVADYRWKLGVAPEVIGLVCALGRESFRGLSWSPICGTPL